MKLSDTADYSVHLLSDDKSKGIGFHHHDDWDESWYILKGSYEICIGDKISILTTGSFITAPKTIRHKVIALENDSQRLAIFKDGVEIIYEN